MAAGIEQQLATYLREQADWRDKKAEEYPDDERNARCAASLRALAAHIEALPEADPNLMVLDSVQADYGLDRFSPSEEGGD